MPAAPREKKSASVHAARYVIRAVPSREQRRRNGIGSRGRAGVSKVVDRETIAALDQAVSFLVRILLRLAFVSNVYRVPRAVCHIHLPMFRFSPAAPPKILTLDDRFPLCR